MATNKSHFESIPVALYWTERKRCVIIFRSCDIAAKSCFSKVTRDVMYSITKQNTFKDSIFGEDKTITFRIANEKQREHLLNLDVRMKGIIFDSEFYIQSKFKLAKPEDYDR